MMPSSSRSVMARVKMVVPSVAVALLALGCGKDVPTDTGTVSGEARLQWSATLLAGRVVYVDVDGLWIRSRDAAATAQKLVSWGPSEVPVGHTVLPARPGEAEIFVTSQSDACVLTAWTSAGAPSWQLPLEGTCRPPAGRARLLALTFGSDTDGQLGFVDADSGTLLSQVALGPGALTMAAYVPGGVGEVSTGGSHWQEAWVLGVGTGIKLVGFDGETAAVLTELELGRTVTSVFAPAPGRIGVTTVSTSAHAPSTRLGDQITRVSVTTGDGGTMVPLGPNIVAPGDLVARPVANATTLVAAGNRWLSVWDWTSGQLTLTLDGSALSEVVTGLALGGDGRVYTGGSHWLVGDGQGYISRRIDVQAGGSTQTLMSAASGDTLSVGSPILGCDGSITLAVYDTATGAVLADSNTQGIAGHDTGWSRGDGGEYGGGRGLDGASCEAFPPRRIAVGLSHSCAIFDGQARCWGSNVGGQVGMGVASPQVETPTLVDGLEGETIIGVAASADFSCAVAESGKVFCWGRGTQGQLGTGALVDTASAQPVATIVDAVAVAVSKSATNAVACALLGDGSHWCWGAATWVGDDTIAQTPQPTGLDGLVSLSPNAPLCGIGQVGWLRCVPSAAAPLPAQDLVTAHLATKDCAATPAGLYCTASTLLDASAPLTPTDLDRWNTEFCAVADQRVVCATESFSGQKDELTLSFEEVAQSQGAEQVAVGNDHACAAMLDGSVRCWGEVGSGLLGNASTSRIFGPSVVPAVSASRVGLGRSYACAGTPGSQTHCWGDDALGQLGGPALGPEPTVVPGLSTVGSLATGANHWCAVVGDGSDVACFGDNSQLQLGSTDTTATSNVVELAEPVSLLATGLATTCALTTELQCWGIVVGKNGTSATPTTVTGTPATVADVALLQNTVCVRAGAEVYCGEFGSALTLQAFTADVLAMAAAETRLCALLSDGSVECIVATGATPSSYIAPPAAVALAPGADHICVLTTTADVYCLGDNLYGQLGQPGLLASDLQWLQVPGLAGVTAIDAFGATACAVLPDSSVACWGDNGEGQVGQPGFAGQPASQKVTVP